MTSPIHSVLSNGHTAAQSALEADFVALGYFLQTLERRGVERFAPTWVSVYILSCLLTHICRHLEYDLWHLVRLLFVIPLHCI